METAKYAEVKIEDDDSDCGPWKILGISKKGGIPSIPWSPQMTTPMPLERLYSLMVENKKDPLPNDRNVLDVASSVYPDAPFLVTKEHFQSSPNGIESSTVTDDLLAFSTLVLSYAKAARGTTLRPGQSPKLFTTFMPRTEFNTIFQQVQNKIPDELFDLLLIFWPAIRLNGMRPTKSSM